MEYQSRSGIVGEIKLRVPIGVKEAVTAYASNAGISTSAAVLELLTTPAFVAAAVPSPWRLIQTFRNMHGMLCRRYQVKSGYEITIASDGWQSIDMPGVRMSRLPGEPMKDWLERAHNEGWPNFNEG